MSSFVRNFLKKIIVFAQNTEGFDPNTSVDPAVQQEMYNFISNNALSPEQINQGVVPEVVIPNEWREPEKWVMFTQLAYNQMGEDVADYWLQAVSQSGQQTNTDTYMQDVSDMSSKLWGHLDIDELSKLGDSADIGAGLMRGFEPPQEGHEDGRLYFFLKHPDYLKDPVFGGKPEQALVNRNIVFDRISPDEQAANGVRSIYNADNALSNRKAAGASSLIKDVLSALSPMTDELVQYMNSLIDQGNDDVVNFAKWSIKDVARKMRSEEMDRARKEKIVDEGDEGGRSQEMGGVARTDTGTSSDLRDSTDYESVTQSSMDIFSQKKDKIYNVSNTLSSVFENRNDGIIQDIKQRTEPVASKTEAVELIMPKLIDIFIDSSFDQIEQKVDPENAEYSNVKEFLDSGVEISWKKGKGKVKKKQGDQLSVSIDPDIMTKNIFNKLDKINAVENLKGLPVESIQKQTGLDPNFIQKTLNDINRYDGIYVMGVDDEGNPRLEPFDITDEIKKRMKIKSKDTSKRQRDQDFTASILKDNMRNYSQKIIDALYLDDPENPGHKVYERFDPNTLREVISLFSPRKEIIEGAIPDRVWDPENKAYFDTSAGWGLRSARAYWDIVGDPLPPPLGEETKWEKTDSPKTPIEVLNKIPEFDIQLQEIKNKKNAYSKKLEELMGGGNKDSAEAIEIKNKILPELMRKERNFPQRRQAWINEFLHNNPYKKNLKQYHKDRKGQSVASSECMMVLSSFEREHNRFLRLAEMKCKSEILNIKVASSLQESMERADSLRKKYFFEFLRLL